MLEFYKAIKEGDPKKRRVAMTLTDGAYLGEKALFFDKELVWCSKEDGFFSCGQPLVEEIKDSGIVVVNGSSVFAMYCQTINGLWFAGRPCVDSCYSNRAAAGI